MIFEIIMNNSSYELEGFMFKIILIIGIILSYFMVEGFISNIEGDKDG